MLRLQQCVDLVQGGPRIPVISGGVSTLSRVISPQLPSDFRPFTVVMTLRCGRKISELRSEHEDAIEKLGGSKKFCSVDLT